MKTINHLQVRRMWLGIMLATLRCSLLTLLLLVSLLAGSAVAQQRAQVTILQTTDLHGHIYPVDYYTNKPDMNGLAKAATIIKQARKETPTLLLLDSGDTIQGTPLVYYHNKKNNQPPDPMMLVMSYLKFVN